MVCFSESWAVDCATGVYPLKTLHRQSRVCVCTCVCMPLRSVGTILWESIGSSLPGSSVHGIFQVRIQEWISISFSRGSFWPGIEATSLVSPALAAGFFTSVALDHTDIHFKITVETGQECYPRIMQQFLLPWVLCHFLFVCLLEAHGC